MREFVITTDSTVDLPKSMLEEKNIPYIPLSYILDGETYEDRKGLSSKEFFDKIRNGSMPTTSQVNPEQATGFFEPFLKEGKDILHIAFSSGLSGTYNSTRIAGEELAEKYPEAKIIIIDSLRACLGQGLLVVKALQQKEQGKDIEEIAQWVREYRTKICSNVTVDDLHHLHRGGRVSKATAILGTVVQIKPIIHMDDEGKLQVIGKERGRKKALNKIVDMMEEQMKGYESENDLIFITHGDCLEDANYLKNRVEKKYGINNVVINDIGTVIGTHTGPGVAAVFCIGNKLQ